MNNARGVMLSVGVTDKKLFEAPRFWADSFYGVSFRLEEPQSGIERVFSGNGDIDGGIMENRCVRGE